MPDTPEVVLAKQNKINFSEVGKVNKLHLTSFSISVVSMVHPFFTNGYIQMCNSMSVWN